MKCGKQGGKSSNQTLKYLQRLLALDCISQATVVMVHADVSRYCLNTTFDTTSQEVVTGTEIVFIAFLWSLNRALD